MGRSSFPDEEEQFNAYKSVLEGIVVPLFVTDARRDTRAIVDMFRAATNRFVGDRYKHGVKVRSWRAQTAARRVKGALPATRRVPAEIEAD